MKGTKWNGSALYPVLPKNDNPNSPKLALANIASGRGLCYIVDLHREFEPLQN